MRATVLQRLNCTRIRPYDPNDHSMLDREGDIQAKFSFPDGKGTLVVDVSFTMKVVDMKTREVWGTVEGEAQTTITDKRIKGRNSSGEMDIPANILKVVEGAIADEVLLPASVVAHSMRLPGLLLPPIELGGNKETANTKS